MKTVRHFAIPLSAMAALFPVVVHATNGMNLEGYGPVATGMGGASMAYDNGSAAVMNNPATIGLMPDGQRADFALGFLGPDVTASVGPMSAKSSGNAYYMPALGWVTKKSGLGYGVALFAQGGMGTEYKADSFMAADSGEKVRSEVSVGRLLFPITYDASPTVHIGGSIDYVWAGMDIKMAMNRNAFNDLVTPGQQKGGKASGSLAAALGGFGLPVNYARFDFSDSSEFTGEAKGSGFAAKIGAVFKVSPELNIGVTYHSKTALSDLSTDNAKVTANVDASTMGGSTNTSLPLEGKIKVRNFEWPATYGVGAMYRPTDSIMIAADVKVIQWADAMKSFNMSFTANQSETNNYSAAFGGNQAADLRGKDLDAELFQNWDDQTVIALGGSYKVDPAWTVRVGYNHASNPIPDAYLNPLFPAIVETHVTAGVGYEFSQASTIDFSLTKGLEASATNPGTGIKSTMSQLNWQVMYSYRY